MGRHLDREKLGYMHVNFCSMTAETGITHKNRCLCAQCRWGVLAAPGHYNEVSISKRERRGQGYLDKDSLSFFLSDPPLWVSSSG